MIFAVLTRLSRYFFSDIVMLSNHTAFELRVTTFLIKLGTGSMMIKVDGLLGCVIISTAQKVLGCALLSLQELCNSKAHSILKGTSHAAHPLFQLMKAVQDHKSQNSQTEKSTHSTVGATINKIIKQLNTISKQWYVPFH